MSDERRLAVADIVERLRSENRMVMAPLHMSDAADEIERLRAQVAELTEAVAEYKHRLHWANEELLKRGRP